MKAYSTQLLWCVLLIEEQFGPTLNNTVDEVEKLTLNSKTFSMLVPPGVDLLTHTSFVVGI